MSLQVLGCVLAALRQRLSHAAYRARFFTSMGLSENISGVISGMASKNGMLAGIKVGKAYNKQRAWRTETSQVEASSA